MKIIHILAKIIKLPYSKLLIINLELLHSSFELLYYYLCNKLHKENKYIF